MKSWLSRPNFSASNSPSQEKLIEVIKSEARLGDSPSTSHRGEPQDWGSQFMAVELPVITSQFGLTTPLKKRFFISSQTPVCLRGAMCQKHQRENLLVPIQKALFGSCGRYALLHLMGDTWMIPESQTASHRNFIPN